MAKQVFAPWTDEQVAALQRHQADDRVHPYTCGNDHGGNRVLIPTHDGWCCPSCDYTQRWAWLNE
jgi:hypothetical protein